MALPQDVLPCTLAVLSLSLPRPAISVPYPAPTPCFLSSVSYYYSRERQALSFSFPAEGVLCLNREMEAESKKRRKNAIKWELARDGDCAYKRCVLTTTQQETRVSRHTDKGGEGAPLRTVRWQPDATLASAP